MNDFKLHGVYVLRGDHLEVAGLFTSRNDAEHFATSLIEEKLFKPVIDCGTVAQWKDALLKERLGQLHDVLLRMEQAEKNTTLPAQPPIDGIRRVWVNGALQQGNDNNLV